MIRVDIPGRGILELEDIVLDLNGTIALDGEVIAGVPQRLAALSESLDVHLVTADTQGQAAVYTTGDLDLPGGQVVVARMPREALSQAGGLGLILVIDGEEVLVGEWLTATQARASWTSSPLLVFIAEHHLRTDMYLPQILVLLGDRALQVIQEEDRELFARALESYISN